MRWLKIIRAGMARGLHIGAQLYVSLRAQAVADVALGESRPGVSMRPDTLMLWLSSGKPLTAVAIAQLWERGLLELDDPVARHIPEFAAGGKESITIRHLLTHTGGFRAVLGKWEDQPWRDVIAAICETKIEPRWIPGETAGYHPLTSWYILGEIIRVLDGRPVDAYVREMICQPIGMNDAWMAILPAARSDYGERIGLMQDTRTSPPAANFSVDTEHGMSEPRPGSSMRGPIRELGLFYETLMRGGTTTRGQKILMPQTIEAMVARHRVGLYDKSFRHIVDFGLGLVSQSNQYGIDTVPYGYGPYASRRTFGHSGSRSSIGYCDPEHGLVVACVFNGAPSEADHDARMRELNAAIYEELGLNTRTNPLP